MLTLGVKGPKEEYALKECPTHMLSMNHKNVAGSNDKVVYEMFPTIEPVNN